MDKHIHTQILTGEIAALSLDTSIFERAGLALESGLLAQLTQFRDSDVELVIASTVANEVRRHLARNATEATKALRSALQETSRHRALAQEFQQQLEALAQASATGEVERASQRLDTWVERSGAQILAESDYVTVRELMRRYEGAEPPFSAEGKKKHEFPDAVALLTLEGWAEERGTRVLVVTQDNDWKRYGVQSHRLIMVDDLGDALAAVQRLEEAGDPAGRLALLLEAGDPLGLQAAVLGAARHQSDWIDFQIEFDSQFTVQEEGFETETERIQLYHRSDVSGSFDTVLHRGHDAVIKVRGLAKVAVELHFSFEKWDGIDREYMDMGGTTLSRQIEVEFEALVNVLTDADGLSVDSVEILPVKYPIYVGELEPDWMNEPDERDLFDAPEPVGRDVQGLPGRRAG
ncbi:PIN domain-containing protein [Burkholderia gladioli]|uniref:PIN domain-containing protein n=1 Tax=Burkholderia gladioli TaxID=28095 RepID=UPI00163DE675|nr:PIN domain-containing protein [Burkholderia gladioli]